MEGREELSNAILTKERGHRENLMQIICFLSPLSLKY